MAETDRAPRHPATQAAQALGRVDPRTRAIVPGIEPATTFLRDPDGGYVSGRIYGRADNPTYEPAEALLSELERGVASLLFASGTAAALAPFQALDPGDHAVIPRAMYWALRAWVVEQARPLGHRGRAGRHDRPGRARRRDATRPDPPGLARDALQPLVGDQRHRRCRRDRAPGRCAARGRFHRGHPGADPAARAGRRSRHALGDQVPERPLRRDRRHPDHGRRRCLVGAAEDHSRPTGRHPRQLRGVAAAARHAHALPARAPELRGGPAHRRAFRRTSRRGRGALPRPARLPRPCPGRTPDVGRLRRHAVDPGARRRGGRHRDRRTGRIVEARHLAGRRGEPDRAPRQHRRPDLTGSGRPAAPFGRHRGA